MKKVCYVCKKEKESTDFNRNKNRIGGLEHYCRECHKERRKLYDSKPAYHIYTNVKNRCTVKSYTGYKNYGGRGITFDETFKTYKIFWDTYGKLYEEAHKKYPNEKIEIDRIDNNGNYTPDNIRFVPRIINQNNKRDNVNITYKNMTMTVTEWAREFELPPATISQRLNNNWPTELLFLRDISRRDSKSLTNYFNK